MFWPVTVLQGSARSLYSVQVDASSNIGVFLSSVGKCRTAKVNNELTSSFLLNWRNPGRKIFSYWLRLTVKIACLVHACLDGTNHFRKAEEAWKIMIAQAIHSQRWHWKSARCDSKRPKVGCSSSSWESHMDSESVRRILREELNIRKVCAKIVPKLLPDEQKERRKKLCLDLLHRTENEPDLLNSIITCDGTWVFAYDPETKRQSMQWKSTSSPRPPHPTPKKRARMSRSKFKAMLTVFFDVQGTVMAEWIPSGQTVNQRYYTEVLTKLRERVRRKLPELWRNGWILHQDNAPAHNSLSVKQFLANRNITVLEHPPPLARPRSLRLLPLPKDQVSAHRNPFCVGKKCERKNGGDPQQPYTTRPAELLWTLAAMYAAVSTQKGTILKAIIVDFLNLLNRKSYRHSLFFFCVCQTSCV